LDKWNTEGAHTFDSMFMHAVKFNQNIDSWDVSQVYNMSKMFLYAAEFN
jgi:surface protein